MIPSFSVPGRSIGTEEVDRFYSELVREMSRAKAGDVFTEKGMSGEYPRYLHKSMHTYLQRSASIAAHAGLQRGRLFDGAMNPLVEIEVLNRISLGCGFNAVVCARISILSYYRKSAGTNGSHNHGSTRVKSGVLDSW